MMKKDGKKYRDDEALKKDSILNVLKQQPLAASKEQEVEEDSHGFKNSMNEDLNELLEKDKKRFFGGCGG